MATLALVWVSTTSTTSPKVSCPKSEIVRSTWRCQLPQWTIRGFCTHNIAQSNHLKRLYNDPLQVRHHKIQGPWTPEYLEKEHWLKPIILAQGRKYARHLCYHLSTIWWVVVSVFFVSVAQGSSMGSRSRFLFFSAGGMMAAEDVLADSVLLMRMLPLACSDWRTVWGPFTTPLNDGRGYCGIWCITTWIVWVSVYNVAVAVTERIGRFVGCTTAELQFELESRANSVACCWS